VLLLFHGGNSGFQIPNMPIRLALQLQAVRVVASRGYLRHGTILTPSALLSWQSLKLSMEEAAGE